MTKKKLTPEQRAKLRQLFQEGLERGEIKIAIIHRCSHCQREFDTEEAFEAHLVDGKYVDLDTGKLNRICPFPGREPPRRQHRTR